MSPVIVATYETGGLLLALTPNVTNWEQNMSLPQVAAGLSNGYLVIDMQSSDLNPSALNTSSPFNATGIQANGWWTEVLFNQLDISARLSLSVTMRWANGRNGTSTLPSSPRLTTESRSRVGIRTPPMQFSLTFSASQSSIATHKLPEP